jgi:hypothetical protein
MGKAAKAIGRPAPLRVQSNLLPNCTRPRVLIEGKRTR